MTEVEWLDADGQPIVSPPQEAYQAARVTRFAVRSLAQWVEIAWLVAAGLAVLAPFLQLYRLQIEHANTQSVDGWGRFDSAVNAAEGAGAHGIRFGVVSVASALVVLVVLALRRLSAARGWSNAAATASGALAVGLLIATSATIFLDIDALLDSVTSELSRFGPREVAPSLHYGAGAWTMLAAAAVGLVALVLDASRRRVTVPPMPTTTLEAPLTPGDERL